MSDHSRGAMDEPALLPISDMASRHFGLSAGVAAAYLEAARVCLDRHHKSPTHFGLFDDEISSVAAVEWEIADDRIRSAWANDTDATEAGAYAIAIAATELSRGLFAIRRAQTKTGADYYLAPVGHSMDDLENWIRLEVSGTDEGSLTDVKSRLLQKVNQARAGASNLPALAAVVGFEARQIAIRSVEQRP